jgi:hypothetical protein
LSISSVALGNGAAAAKLRLEGMPVWAVRMSEAIHNIFFVIGLLLFRSVSFGP